MKEHIIGYAGSSVSAGRVLMISQLLSLNSVKISKRRRRREGFPFQRSLSAGPALAASLPPVAPGSSARAVPAGVERLHSKPWRCQKQPEFWQDIGRRQRGQTFATKLAQRCNGLSCPEASVAMQGQKQEQRVFEATRRLKLSPRKAKWPDRLVLCILFISFKVCLQPKRKSAAFGCGLSF
ncbi:hypothetical protein L1279_003168 [Planomicrobium sp. HSC-17F08]|nr:hypothetical protein [Planomicrobium sp. HSC-17F08]